MTTSTTIRITKREGETPEQFGATAASKLQELIAGQPADGELQDYAMYFDGDHIEVKPLQPILTATAANARQGMISLRAHVVGIVVTAVAGGFFAMFQVTIR